MSDPWYEPGDLMPGDLTAGSVGFSSLPYDMTDEEAEEDQQRRKEREQRRMPGVGFLSPDLPKPKTAPRRRRRKR